MERKADRKRGVELMVGLFVVAGFAAFYGTSGRQFGKFFMVSENLYGGGNV